VLRKAQATFIWDNVDFVVAALHSAARLGDAARREMSGALYSASISGIRTGTPGQPFAEDLEQRDRSREIASRLGRGSLEERFYSDMARAAEERIARELADDVPPDGREW
jgi:hypothetical protein